MGIEKLFAVGIVVTSQQTRFLEKNRLLARRQLQERLDLHFNGEQSLMAQYRREKSEKKESRRLETNRILEKKRAFKAEQDIHSDDQKSSSDKPPA